MWATSAERVEKGRERPAAPLRRSFGGIFRDATSSALSKTGKTAARIRQDTIRRVADGDGLRRAVAYAAPMDTLLSHKTALRLLRDPEVEASLCPTNDQAVFAPPAPMDAFTARDLLRENSALRRAGEPLESVTSEPAGSRVRPAYVSHVWGSELPASSVFQLREGIWCVGPELMALQLAQELPDMDLVLILCELMGTYSVAPGRPGGIVQRPRPLSSPDAIEDFLSSCAGIKGCRAFARAAKLAFPGSASPMETKLALRLTLPVSKGGYGLRLLSLNSSVEVDRIGAGFAEKGIRRPDILIAPWPGSGASPVAIEYDGEEYHLSPEGVAADALRGNELKAAGIGEYRINREMYRNLGYMDDLVSKVREEAGYPRRHRSAADERREKIRRADLYKELAKGGRVY